MEELERQITEAKKQIRQLENLQKRLLSRISDEERRARTHRLIERGAILESLLDGAPELTGEQVRAILDAALHSAAAREIMQQIRQETDAARPPL